jgi:hypothetical protein
MPTGGRSIIREQNRTASAFSRRDNQEEPRLAISRDNLIQDSRDTDGISGDTQ